MRQTHETATSFNQLKEITQSIQAYQTQTQAKKGALKPTKRAFSERQKTTLKKPQASANERLKTKQANKKGGNDEA